MRVTGIDACRQGWVAVSLEAPEVAPLPRGTGRLAQSTGRLAQSTGRLASIRVQGSLPSVLDEGPAPDPASIVGIDMPLGLLESGWREADKVARGLLGPRRSSVFAIPPLAVWAETSYQAANQRCRELTGQGFSVQAWGLRARLLEANRYRETCGHPMYEVHPELAFGAMAGAPLPYSKHTASGRELRRELLARAGILLPAALFGTPPTPVAPVTDTLDAAAVAWSAWRIATGEATVIPDRPQQDRQGREITISY
jgi:predicted RNase H-like nuclease